MPTAATDGDAFEGSSQGADWTNYNRSLVQRGCRVGAVVADPDERRTRGTHSLGVDKRFLDRAVATSFHTKEPCTLQPSSMR